MPDRRGPNEEYTLIRQEMGELRDRLEVLDGKVDNISLQVSVLDGDFRDHERDEKPMFDEILMAVHHNSERSEEIRDSVKGYVELQEDLTVMVRFAKKVGAFLTAVGKFTIVFGVAGTIIKYSYDTITKYFGAS